MSSNVNECRTKCNALFSSLTLIDLSLCVLECMPSHYLLLWSHCTWCYAIVVNFLCLLNCNRFTTCIQTDVNVTMFTETLKIASQFPMNFECIQAILLLIEGPNKNWTIGQRLSTVCNSYWNTKAEVFKKKKNHVRKSKQKKNGIISVGLFLSSYNNQRLLSIWHKSPKHKFFKSIWLLWLNTNTISYFQMLPFIQTKTKTEIIFRSVCVSLVRFFISIFVRITLSAVIFVCFPFAKVKSR